MTVTVDLVQLTKTYKNATEAQRRRHRHEHREGSARGHARALGLRQDDDDEDGRRPAGPHQRATCSSMASRSSTSRPRSARWRWSSRSRCSSRTCPSATTWPSGLRMRGVDKKTRKKRVGEMMELVRPAGHGGASPRPAGRAARSSASLSRAGLITEPDILLLDEPLSQLDANLRIEMRDLIRSIQAELGDHQYLRHPRPGRGRDAGPIASR